MAENNKDDSKKESKSPSSEKKKKVYNPVATSEVTHDLRNRKHETGHEDDLKNLEIKTNEKKSEFTISESSYNELNAYKDFTIIALDLKESELSGNDIEKLVNELNFDTAKKIAQKQLEKEIRANKRSKEFIQEDTLTASSKTQEKSTCKKQTYFLLIVSLFIAGTTIGTWYLFPQKIQSLFNPQENSPNSSRTFILDLSQRKQALEELFEQTNKDIVWITHQLSDEHILSLLSEQQKRGKSITIIAGRETGVNAKEIGLTYKLTIYQTRQPTGPISWLILDDKQLVDITTRYAAHAYTDDPRTTAYALEWIQETFSKNINRLH